MARPSTRETAPVDARPLCRWLFVLTLQAVAFTTSTAVHAEDIATADALFREGMAKRRANQLAQACALFQESHRLDPAGGTTFALADCLEAQGKLAQAAARYHEAGAIARQRKNAEKERLVEERLARIEPRLPMLTVNVDAAWRKLSGLVVTRDDQELGPPMYGLAVPVDPGAHVVRFTADGVVPFSTTIAVAERARSVVDPPAPAPLPEALHAGVPAPLATPLPPADPATPPPSVPPARVPSTSPTRLVVAGSLGVVGLTSAAIAVASFVSSRSKVDEAAPFCPDGCDARGHSLYEDARSRHYLGIAFGASAVALLAGAGVLGLTDLGKGGANVTLAPQRLSVGYGATF